jgi:hypothetical protein
MSTVVSTGQNNKGLLFGLVTDINRKPGKRGVVDRYRTVFQNCGHFCLTLPAEEGFSAELSCSVPCLPYTFYSFLSCQAKL